MKATRCVIVVLPVLFVGLAIAAGSRVITVKAENRSGNLRTGPYVYTGNVQGKVQSLEIRAEKATLTAPQGMDMGEAEGKRVAGFDGPITVTRGRLTAKGVSLEYKEETGLGVLAGPTNIVQKPEKKDDDDVVISAQKATFDVDSDISTSAGAVKLQNGKQSAQADKIQFDERCDLALITDDKQVSLVREPKKAGESKLTITGKEARSLTNDNLLVATGGVTLVSGDNTTTGAALYYDDATGIAYVVGDEAKKIPAKNINKKNGSVLNAGTIENNTRKNSVKQLGQVYKIPLEKFKFPCVKP